MKESTYCALCGTTLSRELLHWFHGQLYCEHCLEEHTAIYYKCKERSWLEPTAATTTITYASTATMHNYTNCHRVAVMVCSMKKHIYFSN